MPTRPSIPWLRIAVEALMIVSSVLAALAIDAWWAGVQDREAEQSALHALRVDFLVSREGLATGIAALTRAQSGFAALQSSTLEDLSRVPPDSADQLVGHMVVAFTYDPVTSAPDALLNDGRVSLLRDSQLREALAERVRAVELAISGRLRSLLYRPNCRDQVA